ncbi:MAG: hypothetical protein HC905_22495 [Bacteroidales bacterium]|nr:hypothetical protein [Bacteroidales bacterium]
MGHFSQLSGILKLIKGAKSGKTIDALHLSPRKIENETDKQLIKYCRNLVNLANKIGGFTLNEMKDISPERVNSKLSKAQKLSDDFGLTRDMVKKLEEAAQLFIKRMADAELSLQNQHKIIRSVNKHFDFMERTLKTKIDKFVEVYEKKDSKFLKEYTALRAKPKKEKEQPVVQIA